MFFLRRKWLKIKAWMLIFTIMGPIVRPVLGEYFSILEDATVSASTPLNGSSSNVHNLISKSFKAMI